MSMILSLFLIIGPIAISFCAVKAVQHTIIIRQAKRRNEIPTALIASLWASNGPDRRWNVK
jgi:hypothetical protein